MAKVDRYMNGQVKRDSLITGDVLPIGSRDPETCEGAHNFFAPNLAPRLWVCMDCGMVSRTHHLLTDAEQKRRRDRDDPWEPGPDDVPRAIPGNR